MHGWAATNPPPTGEYTANRCSDERARNTVMRAALAWSWGPTCNGKTLAAAALTNPATSGELPGGHSACTCDARRLLPIASAVPGDCRGSWAMRASGPSKAVANSGTFTADVTFADTTVNVGPGWDAVPLLAPRAPVGNKASCQ